MHPQPPRGAPLLKEEPQVVIEDLQKVHSRLRQFQRINDSGLAAHEKSHFSSTFHNYQQQHKQKKQNQNHMQS